MSAASDSEFPADAGAAPVKPGARYQFDVFISHSSIDKTLADAVCHTLEANGLRCWIAPRDIVPGSEWSEGIFQGIDSSRTFVLVFTNHANESKHVLREVGRAFSKNLVVIPFRVEDIQPSRGLEYWISQSHWLDAMTPPFQQHLERLVQVVRKNVGPPPPATHPEPEAPVPAERTPTSVPPGPGGPGAPTLPAQSKPVPQPPARQRPPASTPPPRAVREEMRPVASPVKTPGPPLPTGEGLGVRVKRQDDSRNRPQNGSDSTKASQPKSASPPQPPARGPLPVSIPPWALWVVGAALLLGIALFCTIMISAIISPPAPGGHESAESPARPPAPPAESLTGTQAGDTREIALPGEVKLKLIWCLPGTFTMGTPGATDLEAPVQVTLTKGYWLGQTEVTQAQWTAVMGAASKPWSGKTYVKEGPNFPASYISHGVNPDGTIEADSATAFCEKLTEIERKAGRLPTGWKYALPTEAQWEYACRAGTKTAYSFGDDDAKLGEYAWFDKNAYAVGEKYAHAVGTKKPNPWGLSDMHGNLYEWCRDGFADKLAGGTDPLNVSTVDRRVLRGGSWVSNATYSRSAYRYRSSPVVRDVNAGFRVSRTQ